MTRIVPFLFAPLDDDGCIKAPKQEVNNICYYKYKYVWYTLSLRCLVLIKYLQLFSFVVCGHELMSTIVSAGIIGLTILVLYLSIPVSVV